MGPGAIELAVLAVFANRAVSNPLLPASRVVDLLEVTLAYVGAVAFCTSALALVREAIRVDRRTLAVLQSRLIDVEDEARRDRERLHEVKGTIASIASASRLISAGSIALEQRPGLEQMLAAESQRLDRMLQGADNGGASWVDVDPVLHTLIVGQRARGHDVRWTRSRLRVLVVEDQLAEILSVLLDNAHRHGAGTTEIGARVPVSGFAEIRVTDEGPGIPTNLGDSVFEWGVRSDHSAGSGIGLNVARRLARENHGDLRVEPRDPAGATFVLLLPTKDIG